MNLNSEIGWGAHEPRVRFSATSRKTLMSQTPNASWQHLRATRWAGGAPSYTRVCSPTSVFGVKTVLRRRSLIGLFALLVAMWFVDAAELKFPLPLETSKFKPGDGAILVTVQCLTCHSADYISTQPKLSRAAWKATVVKMQQKYGSQLPA